MAQALGLDLVAEGVETAEVSYLRERGCYSIQGYLISSIRSHWGACQTLVSKIFVQPSA